MTAAAPDSKLHSGDMTSDGMVFDVKEFWVVVKIKERKFTKSEDHGRSIVSINFTSLARGSIILLFFFLSKKGNFSNFIAWNLEL